MDPIQIDFDLGSLKVKSALVTGGASGIGLATVRSWAAAGVYVTIADIQPIEQGQKLAEELSSTSGGHVNYAWCDVTDWDSQIAAFKSAVGFSPSQTLDIVATFAGTAFAPYNEVDHVLAAGEPSLEVNPKRPDIRNIEINLTGVYYSSWLALYYFRLKPKPETKTIASEDADALNGTTESTDSTVTPEAPTKSLILVASIAAYMDSPKASTYPASKFGVRGLFRSTRARTLDIGVRCNLLAPWFIDTPLVAPVKNALASRGIDMAKALSFASIESCVEAASYCAADPKIHGTFFFAVISPHHSYLPHPTGATNCISTLINLDRLYGFFFFCLLFMHTHFLKISILISNTGRALAIQPEGIFDLKDDFENGWAGDQLRPIVQRRRDAGFNA